MRKVGVLIQARMSSTRLPGKVLKPVHGAPLIDRVVERARRCRSAQEVAVVTSTHPDDDVLCAHLERSGIPYHRGSLNDVLGRYAEAANRFGLDVIVRVTADCPLIDPELLERMILSLADAGADAIFSSDSVPDGFRANVFTSETLRRAAKNATLKSEREHVSPYIWNHPQEFKVIAGGPQAGPSALHLSVDYEEDLRLAGELYRRLYPANPAFTMEDVLKELDRDPSLAAINASIDRVDGYAKSKAEDGPMPRIPLALYCVEDASDIAPALKWRLEAPAGVEREIVVTRTELERRLDPWTFVPLDAALGAADYGLIDRSMRELGSGWMPLTGTTPPEFRGAPLEGFFASPLTGYFFWVLKQAALWDILLAGKRPAEIVCTARSAEIRCVGPGSRETVTTDLLQAFAAKFSFRLKAIGAAPDEAAPERGSGPSGFKEKMTDKIRQFLYAAQNQLAGRRSRTTRIVYSGAVSVLGPVRAESAKRDLPSIHLKRRYDLASFGDFVRSGVVTSVIRDARANGAPARVSGSYLFRGVDVLKIARPKLEHVLREAYPRVLRRLESLDAFFGETRPEWVVVDEDVSDWNRSVVTAARAAGVKTIVCQHGLPGDPVGYAPVAADFFGAWGRESAEKLKSWGVPAQKIVELGAPRYDALFKRADRDGVRDRVGRILVILPKTKTSRKPGRYGIDHLTLVYTQKVIEAVFAALRGTGREVRLKPHPAETQLEALREWLGRNAPGVPHAVADAAVSASSLMEGCSLVIGCESAAMLEALILGIPSICVNFSGGPDVYDLTATGACAGVTRAADVRPAVEFALSKDSEAVFLKKRAELLPYYFAETTGRAAARFVDRLAASREEVHVGQ